MAQRIGQTAVNVGATLIVFLSTLTLAGVRMIAGAPVPEWLSALVVTSAGGVLALSHNTQKDKNGDSS